MRPFLLGLLLSGAASAVATLPALADQNTLTIRQEGIGNTISVDQSRATGSEIKGLKLNSGLLDPNSLQIELIDEAQQLGGNNDAEIDISGAGGRVYLYQNNTLDAPSGNGRNTASIDSENGGVGLVWQNGFDNTARLEVNGGLDMSPALIVGQQNIDGAILQYGSNNNGSVVTGEGSALLVQNGDGNNAELDVSASPAGTSVVYTQNGNNMNSAAAAQVFTTAVGGTVSVTQSSFGSVTSRGAVTVTQTAR
jgi:hypothetical protein